MSDMTSGKKVPAMEFCSGDVSDDDDDDDDDDDAMMMTMMIMIMITR